MPPVVPNPEPEACAFPVWVVLIVQNQLVKLCIPAPDMGLEWAATYPAKNLHGSKLPHRRLTGIKPNGYIAPRRLTSIKSDWTGRSESHRYGQFCFGPSNTEPAC